MKRLRLLRPVALAALVLVSACTSKTTKDASQPLGAASGSPAAQSGTLNLAIWSNYVSPEMIAEFEKSTGIKVNVSNYSSNEELLAKLQAGASGIDVAVPSDYMVFAMAKLGLLTELDRAQLPNFKHLNPQFMGKSYDPQNKVSLPFNWGTTGIAVNRDLYKGSIKGWKDLFGSPELKGKFTLLDDSRETLGAALKALGFPLNSRDPAQLAKAKDLLLKQASRVKGFNSEAKMPLINGEVVAAHAYSSDALQASKAKGGKIDYIVPEEGGTLWIDNLVIPKGAKDLREAHAFLNFILEPANAVKSVTTLFLATANLDALGLVPSDLRANLSLFPAPAQQAKLEMMEDLGDAVTQYDRIWTEIKAGGQ